MSRRFGIGQVAAAAAVAALLCCAAAGAENRLELGADQTVTVAGSFGSLKDLLADLCDQGGIELRSFDAADRGVTVRYESVPLTTALRGLLREESYLLGVAAQPGTQGSRVTWIRVMAKGDGAAGGGAVPTGPGLVSRAANPAPPEPLPEAEEDPARIAQIAVELADRLFAKPEQVGPFLETSPQVIAGTFRKYPEAKSIVRQLRDEQSDPEIRNKLEQVLEILR